DYYCQSSDITLNVLS
nr:immunoglobulin light chain junction region [Macaca mulatta]